MNWQYFGINFDLIKERLKGLKAQHYAAAIAIFCLVFPRLTTRLTSPIWGRFAYAARELNEARSKVIALIAVQIDPSIICLKVGQNMKYSKLDYSRIQSTDPDISELWAQAIVSKIEEATTDLLIVKTSPQVIQNIEMILLKKNDQERYKLNLLEPEQIHLLFRREHSFMLREQNLN